MSLNLQQKQEHTKPFQASFNSINLRIHKLEVKQIFKSTN